MKNTCSYEELVQLIENRDFEPVTNWLKSGGDPDLGIREHKTALTLQVIYELYEEGDEKEVVALLEVFLKYGASTDPSSMIKPGELLFEALGSGNRDAVKLLVDYGADCNVIDETDYPRLTPLIAAVEINDPELVQLILPPTSRELLHVVAGHMVSTALGCACWNLNEEIIELLLKAGANPYFKEWDHLNEYSKDLIPADCSTEQRERVNELVARYSRYSEESTMN